MNFNNCSYFDSLPITVRFSKKVGEILQYLPDTTKLRTNIITTCKFNKTKKELF